MKKCLFLVVMVMIMFIGCADTIPVDISNINKVGFWYGLWHGWIVGIAWFCSLFSDNTSIYAAYNNGGWYDFGFLIGVGGLSASSCSVKRRK